MTLKLRFFQLTPGIWFELHFDIFDNDIFKLFRISYEPSRHCDQVVDYQQEGSGPSQQFSFLGLSKFRYQTEEKLGTLPLIKAQTLTRLK